MHESTVQQKRLEIDKKLSHVILKDINRKKIPKFIQKLRTVGIRKKKVASFFTSARDLLNSSLTTKSLRNGIINKLLHLIVFTCLILVWIEISEPIPNEPFLFATEYLSLNSESIDIQQFLSKFESDTFCVVKIINYDKVVFQFDGYELTTFKKFLSKNGITELHISFDDLLWSSNFFHLLITLYVTAIFIVTFINLDSIFKRNIFDKIENLIILVNSISLDPTNINTIHSLQKRRPNKVMDAIQTIINKEEINSATEGKKNTIDWISTKVLKLSSLLAIGLGLAGSKIVKNSLESQGSVALIKEGHRTLRICVFIEVSNFSDWSKKLSEKSIELINLISEIIHSEIYMFNGYCIKNLGESFFCVWHVSHFDDEEQPFNDCMLAIISCLIKIRKRVRQLNLRYLKQLHFASNSIYLRFGAHFGEAIEGPIGSLHKIDPSYLGSCVNIAARMCSASKLYGVEGLITNLIYDRLNQDLKEQMRLVDIICVKGSNVKFKVFALNIDLDKVSDSQKIMIQVPFKEKKEFFMMKKALLNHKVKESYLNVVEYCLSKRSFDNALRISKNNKKYLEAYSEGMQNYIYGNWRIAYKHFKSCLRYRSGDKATLFVVRFINKNKMEAPEGWEGSRNLDMK